MNADKYLGTRWTFNAQSQTVPPPIIINKQHKVKAHANGLLENLDECEVVIFNPVKRGAAIDYKTTAQILADQLWETWNEGKLIEQDLRRRTQQLRDTIAYYDKLKSHWFLRFFFRKV